MQYVLREGSQEPIPFYLTRDDRPYDLSSATEVRLCRKCGSGLDDTLSTLDVAAILVISEAQQGKLMLSPTTTAYWTGTGHWAALRFEVFDGGIRLDFPNASSLRFKIVTRD